jgi:hypothetical protein
VSEKYLVAWDFSKRPSGTFYRILTEEFGSSYPGGEVALIQRSVARCRDDFVARRLAALAEYFGAKVDCFQVEQDHRDDEARTEGRAFVERILHQRLHRRGRRPTQLSRR